MSSGPLLLLKPVREDRSRFFLACVGLLAIFGLPGLEHIIPVLRLHMGVLPGPLTSSSFSVCVDLYVHISHFDNTSYIEVHPPWMAFYSATSVYALRHSVMSDSL